MTLYRSFNISSSIIERAFYRAIIVIVVDSSSTRTATTRIAGYSIRPRKFQPDKFHRLVSEKCDKNDSCKIKCLKQFVSHQLGEKCIFSILKMFLATVQNSVPFSVQFFLNSIDACRYIRINGWIFLAIAEKNYECFPLLPKKTLQIYWFTKIK